MTSTTAVGSGTVQFRSVLRDDTQPPATAPTHHITVTAGS